MRNIVEFLVVASFIVCLFTSSSCGSDNNENGNSDTIKTSLARNFSVSDYNFAILENKEFIKYNKAIYQRGDEVYMVLEDVGPLARGSDSLNHAEMKLEVVDAIGQEVTLRENLFGVRGHRDFPDNMLKEPYASYSSELKDKPGKYTMTVTIYDLIRKDSIVVSDDFYLE